MSLQHQFSFSPSSSIQVQGSQNTSTSFIIPTPKTSKSALGQITFGNLSNTGTLGLDLFTGLESATSAAWIKFATASLTASSTIGLALTSLNSGLGIPLMPYVQVKVSGLAGGAGVTVFENIVAKLALD